MIKKWNIYLIFANEEYIGYVNSQDVMAHGILKDINLNELIKDFAETKAFAFGKEDIETYIDITFPTIKLISLRAIAPKMSCKDFVALAYERDFVVGKYQNEIQDILDKAIEIIKEK
jgi:hypothetical protein